MKIIQIRVQVAPTADDESRVVNAVYDAVNGYWQIDGPIYPRHLKVLTTIADECRGADKGIK